MSLKKKDLRMTCSLRWKHDPKRQNVKSFVVVEDIPYITMNLEVFKKELLQNSGTPIQPINVSLIMDNGKEYPINSQVDFQVALYTFRRNARAGEEIPLLLEKLSDRPDSKNSVQSNDAQTQIDTAPKTRPVVLRLKDNNTEACPEWFRNGMARLKAELVEEVADKMKETMNEMMAEFSKPQVAASSSRTRKRDKVLKKHLPESGADPKDLIKSYKLERKLEVLEHKASKCRERRLALQPRLETKSSDSEPSTSSSKPVEGVKKEEPQMDARPVNEQSSFPYMLGGEVYLHQWEVKNTGQVTWNSETQLQYTWGSKKLVPVEKTVSVPHLNPGEQGVVSVCLQVPTQGGKYECYWQFEHKGRRFGQWLGVQLVVKGLEGDTASQPMADLEVELHNLMLDSAKQLNDMGTDLVNEAIKMESQHIKSDEFVLEDDSDCSWSSEPTHFWSKTEEKGDYVLVPVPQCFVLDTPEGSDKNATQPGNFDSNNNGNAAATTEDKNSIAETSTNSIKLRDEELDNIVVITVPKDDQVREGFIYVHVDGQKVLIPKNILKSEVVTAAQELERSPSAAKSVGVIVDGASKEASSQVTESPTPSVASTLTQTPEPNADSAPTLQEPLIPQQAVDLTTAARDHSEERSNYFEASNYMSHCSATGSCFSDANAHNRIFVFPQDIPGYEVVCPAAPDEQPANPFMEPVANYQQTLPEERVAPELLARPPSNGVTAASAPAEQVHILPEALVSGAVNVASSAFNTARSVINMIKPQQAPGRWDNGHWVSTSPMSVREQNLQALADMGFWNRDLNATLLARHNDDLNRVVAELVQ